MALSKEPEWVFPFEGMEVGDSFFIPTLLPTELLYALDCGAKRARVKIKSYIVVNNDLLGVRTWRMN